MALTLYFTLDLRALRDGKGQAVCPDPIEFWAKPFLEKQHRELMQAHFGLTEKEREDAQHAYNVKLLSMVAERTPKGIPGCEGKDAEKAVLDALSEKTEVNEMIADLLVQEHLAAGGNRYFFR